MAQQIGFLSLPLELRFMVYEHISPVNAPVSAYQGLLLSCMTVYSEASAEIVRNARAFLKTLKKPEDESLDSRAENPNVHFQGLTAPIPLLERFHSESSSPCHHHQATLLQSGTRIPLVHQALDDPLAPSFAQHSV
ncbi:hypothetical protein K491DRAFT_684104 [Lophiostoma macrostomum CBS 122681]|uniref:Uncharacterized protein n=1 Tax=Lophiostoma macrostomum CBS 122681 TaxID=1314788 RepID=A0A6A6SMQ9_9PLEO|nr:hypothetical protein K491DRAFT_684104 [Lophiostoma macrostomum CBS 122681]